MTLRQNVAILISGRGSNMQSLVRACSAPDYPAKVVLVLSNKADATGLDYAREAGIATAVISHKDYPDRASFDAAMDAEIRRHGAELICLAGFMRLLDSRIIEAWRDRMINIHPSLLPSFRGLDTHERALEAGVKLAGCSVHFVRPDVDTGPIIAQAAVPVLPDDTPDSLAARVLEQEHMIYPMALRLVAEGRVRVEGDRAFVDASCTIRALRNPVSL
ncbi:MAG: phosphoribosylglycinamide formyltransferase [Alphaproteobacteria bacterium]|nr:phosphoribosylglycinamide formyltransferase [Alphaproteobacteria bacterium]